MSPEDIDKAYVSPFDQFLYTFDANHPKTPSQQKEIKKHQRITKLRDQASPADDETLWEKF